MDFVAKNNIQNKVKLFVNNQRKSCNYLTFKNKENLNKEEILPSKTIMNESNPFLPFHFVPYPVFTYLPWE